MTATRSRAIGAALLVAAFALASTGCDRGPSADPVGDGRDEIRKTAIQYASCMRERGYEMPDPTFDEQGLPRFAGPVEVSKRQDFDSDQRECRTALNTALQAAGVGSKQKATPEQLVAFTRCVREQGLQVADPQPGENLQIDKAVLNSPAWPAAVDACKQHLPPDDAIGLTKTGKK